MSFNSKLPKNINKVTDDFKNLSVRGPPTQLGPRAELGGVGSANFKNLSVNEQYSESKQDYLTRKLNKVKPSREASNNDWWWYFVTKTPEEMIEKRDGVSPSGSLTERFSNNYECSRCKADTERYRQHLPTCGTADKPCKCLSKPLYQLKKCGLIECTYHCLWYEWFDGKRKLMTQKPQ